MRDCSLFRHATAAAAISCTLILFCLAGCRTANHRPDSHATAMHALDPDVPVEKLSAAQLRSLQARFAPAELRAGLSHLSPGDRAALPKLLEAASILNTVFMNQIWSGNLALYAKLQEDRSELGQARLDYFWLNKGPWSALDDHRAFLPGVPPRKPERANFYPEEISREEFEAWVAKLPAQQKRQAQGFFWTVGNNSSGQLTLVPYSREYAQDLNRAADLLKQAAAATSSPTLRNYLTLRAQALLDDDYFASDVAWMDLDADLEITYGPYETYNDEMFGYKAAFEAYISVRDLQETGKLQFFGQHLQEIENALPIDPEYKNPKLGAMAPIWVVNQIYAAGDASHGVQTAAYNLPNDERVIRQKGSKRVMLKNVQQAKFQQILVPISRRVLPPASHGYVHFDAFFTHILAHELTHGIGPHQTYGLGRSSTPRQELKEHYSAIEEAKADICGLFMMQYLFDHSAKLGIQDPALQGGSEAESRLYTTFLASSFRTLRFGANEAHAKGMAVQFNYLTDQGAIVINTDGTFDLRIPRMKEAVRALARELLTIEARGDYAAAQKLLADLGVIRPPLAQALEKLRDLPTDIRPVFVTASEIVAGIQ
jgi:hypothetical protein